MSEMYGRFAEVYDLFMEDVPYDRWTENITGFLKENGIGQGLICELGCGTGAITRRLAAAGYDMTGIDISSDMLTVAREYDSEGILYLNQDMREFELYGTMAGIVSVCDSMNYLTDDGDMEKVLALVKNYLDPGGIFVFDLNTLYKYENVLGVQTIADSREEGSFIWDNYFDPDSRINEYELTLFIRKEGGLYSRHEELHLQRAYEIDEVTAMIGDAGLKVIKTVDADTLGEVRADSERVYFVVKKGESDD